MLTPTTFTNWTADVIFAFSLGGRPAGIPDIVDFCAEIAVWAVFRLGWVAEFCADLQFSPFDAGQPATALFISRAPVADFADASVVNTLRTLWTGSLSSAVFDLRMAAAVPADEPIAALAVALAGLGNAGSLNADLIACAFVVAGVGESADTVDAALTCSAVGIAVTALI